MRFTKVTFHISLHPSCLLLFSLFVSILLSRLTLLRSYTPTRLDATHIRLTTIHSSRQTIQHQSICLYPYLVTCTQYPILSTSNDNASIFSLYTVIPGSKNLLHYETSPGITLKHAQTHTLRAMSQARQQQEQQQQPISPSNYTSSPPLPNLHALNISDSIDGQGGNSQPEYRYQGVFGPPGIQTQAHQQGWGQDKRGSRSGIPTVSLGICMTVGWEKGQRGSIGGGVEFLIWENRVGRVLRGEEGRTGKMVDGYSACRARIRSFAI